MPRHTEATTHTPQTAIYMEINRGAIIETRNEPFEGSTPFVTKKGKTLHEARFMEVEGTLTDIKLDENEWGKYWIITLNDVGELYKIRLPYSSSHTLTLLKKLPSVKDFSEPIMICAWEEKGNNPAYPNTALNILQKGQKVPTYFTKDDPKGLPPFEQHTINGKTLWDTTACMEFLWNTIKTTILPRLPK